MTQREEEAVHLTSETAIRELDSRSNDSIDVALLWNSQTNRVYLAVQDKRRGEAIEFEADPADALTAFTTPSPTPALRREPRR